MLICNIALPTVRSVFASENRGIEKVKKNNSDIDEQLLLLITYLVQDMQKFTFFLTYMFINILVRTQQLLKVIFCLFVLYIEILKN